MDRPNWDDIHMNTAKLYAARGTCPRLQVGIVFVRDNRPVSVGYNGAPSGMPHCNDVGCDLYIYGENAWEIDQVKNKGIWQSLPLKEVKTRCRRSIHAEPNGIGYAARNGISLEGTTAYLWPIGPCTSCELLLATINIKEIVFPSTSYNYDVSAPVLKKMGVEVRHYELPVG